MTRYKIKSRKRKKAQYRNCLCIPEMKGQQAFEDGYFTNRFKKDTISMRMITIKQNGGKKVGSQCRQDARPYQSAWGKSS